MDRKIRTMQKEYGMASCGSCRQCCNFQFAADDRKKRVCIAYGDRTDADCSWDGEYEACGLLNQPFLGLVPRRRPLVELTIPTRRRTNEVPPEQASLF